MNTRKILTAAVTLGISAAATATVAPSATASTGPIVSLQNRATSACVDDSIEFGLRSFPCNGLIFQRWEIKMTSLSVPVIVSRATGRCIDDGPEGFQARNCDRYAYQLWYERDSSGKELRNVSTSRCLDDSDAGLRTFACNNLLFQRWNFLG